MATVASLRLGIDASGARIGAAQFDQATDRVGRSAGLATRSVGTLKTALLGLKTALISLPALVAGGGLALFSRSIITAASDAEELESKFRVVFKGVNDDAEEAASTMSAKLRRSIVDVKEAMAGFQDTFVPMGFARDSALELSEALAQLSFDLSSFYNRSQAEVIRDLQSALVGQTETVRKYGVVILESNVKQEALRLGLAKTGEELNEQQKILARLSLLYQGTSDAQGDLVRTQDSFANRMREVQGVIKDMRIEFGQRLVDAIDRAIEGFGGMERFQRVIRVGFVALTDTIEEAIETLGVFAGKVADAVDSFGGMERIEEISRSIADAVGAAFQGIVATVGELLISISEVLRGLPRIMAAAFRAGGDELKEIFADIFPWLDPPRTQANLQKWAADARASIIAMVRGIDREAAELLEQIPEHALASTAEALTSAWDTEGWSGGVPVDSIRKGVLEASQSFRDLLDEIAQIRADKMGADEAIEAFAGFDPDRLDARLEEIIARFGKVGEIMRRPAGVPGDYRGPELPLIPTPKASDYGPPAPSGLDLTKLLSPSAATTAATAKQVIGPAFTPPEELYPEVPTDEVAVYLAQLEQQIDLEQIAGKYGEERAREEASVLQARQIALDQWLAGERTVPELYQAEEEAIRAANKALEDQISLNRFMSRVGETLASGFEQAIVTAREFGDVLQSLARDMAQLFLRRFVTAPLFGALGLPIASAKGNVFERGEIVPFAKGGVFGAPAPALALAGGGSIGADLVHFARGGVVDRPTLFPLSRGKTGIMGEAGAEAVLPLKRGRDGKLGVSAVPFASGGIFSQSTYFPMQSGKVGVMGESGPEAIMPLERGSDGKLGVKATGATQTYNITMNVNGVRDADSFRRSERQIASGLTRRLGRGA